MAPRYLGSWRALVVAVALVGCVRKPTMTLDHAELSGIGIQLGAPPTIGVLMTVVLNVSNPNDYDVAVRAVRGMVVFGDRYAHPVIFRAPGDGVWLRANTVTKVAVPVELPIALAFALARDAAFSPTIPYRFTGTADVTATSSLRIEKDGYEVDEIGALTRQQMEAVLLPHSSAGASVR